MATATTAGPTYSPEEFLLLPDSVAYELDDGYLVERNVSEKSAAVGMQVGFLLKIETDKTLEARVYGADLKYQCFADPRTMRRPDVSLIRSSRITELDDPGIMPIPADLAVEVISPNDLVYDVERKIDLYLSAGFRIVWAVNPELKTVTVYKADGTSVWLHETDELTVGDALPTFRRKVSELFRI